MILVRKCVGTGFVGYYYKQKGGGFGGQGGRVVNRFTGLEVWGGRRVRRCASLRGWGKGGEGVLNCAICYGPVEIRGGGIGKCMSSGVS